MRGSTRASIHKHELDRDTMDCRVKPGQAGNAMWRRRANQNALTKHCGRRQRADRNAFPVAQGRPQKIVEKTLLRSVERQKADRKSTRLNSSHLGISYAVFCLK